jgi:hypothetical protein
MREEGISPVLSAKLGSLLDRGRIIAWWWGMSTGAWGSRPTRSSAP